MIISQIFLQKNLSFCWDLFSIPSSERYFYNYPVQRFRMLSYMRLWLSRNYSFICEYRRAIQMISLAFYLNSLPFQNITKHSESLEVWNRLHPCCDNWSNVQAQVKSLCYEPQWPCCTTSIYSKRLPNFYDMPAPYCQSRLPFELESPFTKSYWAFP